GESPTKADKRNAYVLPLSIVTHLVVVAIAVIVPIFAPGVLPVPAATLRAFISPAVPTPPPPPAAPPSHATPAAHMSAESVNPLLAPIAPPREIAPERVGETTRGVIQGVEGGDGHAWEGGVGTRLEPPPAPPPPADPAVL